jgi:hypothetical protein
MSTKTRDFSSIQKDLGVAANVLQSIAKPLLAALTFSVPIAIKSCKFAYSYYSRLPQNAILFVTGFVFCFFGGTFPVLFAAVQAAEYGGRQAVMLALSDLADEAIIIIEESKKDDVADDDKDGKADVAKISNAEFLSRKTQLVLKKMNPEKIDRAVGSLYKVWLAVAAVLSIEFAKTISMALTISEFLRKPLNRFLAPTVMLAIPNDYDKWVPVVLGWIAKSIAISIAFYVQSLVSGLASALRGGLLMARATYQFLVYRKINLFGLIPDDNSESVLDEALSYIFAGLGFYTQFRAGFSLPTPLNYVLWPFQVAEYYLRWSITKRVTASK